MWRKASPLEVTAEIIGNALRHILQSLSQQNEICCLRFCCCALFCERQSRLQTTVTAFRFETFSIQHSMVSTNPFKRTAGAVPAQVSFVIRLSYGTSFATWQMLCSTSMDIHCEKPEYTSMCSQFQFLKIVTDIQLVPLFFCELVFEC